MVLLLVRVKVAELSVQAKQHCSVATFQQLRFSKIGAMGSLSIGDAR
jgi:hypothetical protein